MRDPDAHRHALREPHPGVNRIDVRQALSAWLRQRFASLVERLNNVVHGPQPSAGCVPLIGNESGATVTLPTPQAEGYGIRGIRGELARPGVALVNHRSTR